MRELIIIGMGELGSLYGAAALRAGIRVTPGTRAVVPEWKAAPILVAVGEDALPGVLAGIPEALRDDVILLQNELFPSLWTASHVENPTVMVQWFSKKKGRPIEPSRPTLVHGRHAALVEELHRVLGVACEVTTETRVRDEALVAKYTFILTINALGVVEDLTLGAWLQKDPARVDLVMDDARRLGEALLGAAVDGKRVRTQVLEAFTALAHYPSRGRTAQARVQRAHEQAARLSVELHAI